MPRGDGDDDDDDDGGTSGRGGAGGTGTTFDWIMEVNCHTGSELPIRAIRREAAISNVIEFWVN
jgi:hypothetical protein